MKILLAFLLSACCAVGQYDPYDPDPAPAAGGGPSSLLTGLVAYWKLDEASGTRNDSVGANHLTDASSVGSAAGKLGNAASFATASTDSLSLSDNAEVSTGDVDFTFAFWLYLTDEGGPYIPISKDEESNRDYTFDFNAIGGSKTLRFYINGGAVNVESASGLSASTWYFVVAWHDSTANTLNLKINNGTTQSVSTGGTTPTDSGSAFRIGGRNYSGFEWWLNGLVDDVGLWKGRILTSGEMTEIYNSGNGVTYPFTP
jgi:hypothetical protein